MNVEPAIRIDVHTRPEDIEETLHTDVRVGLAQSPKSLPPKWFYDERGSQLFDEITRLDEYYVTRVEKSILASHARDIARASGADTLVELGSGTAEKTRLLLDALKGPGKLVGYIPFDVSEEVLRESAAGATAPL